MNRDLEWLTHDLRVDDSLQIRSNLSHLVHSSAKETFEGQLTTRFNFRDQTMVRYRENEQDGPQMGQKTYKEDLASSVVQDEPRKFHISTLDYEEELDSRLC